MNVEELYNLTAQEIKQRQEEGCDVGEIRSRHAGAAEMGDARKQAACDELLGELADLDADAKYVEPSDLPGIRELRAEGPRQMQNSFSGEDLFRRIHGGWLGRCAGCQLGKPVEGADRAFIHEVATLDANYPLKDYFAPVVRQGEPAGRRLRVGDPWLRGHMHGMARDDDIDYTVAGLLILERWGAEFTTENVAEFWLAELPFHKVYTAERIAYRNLVGGVEPARAGEVLNPCREWIGAQIRADAFGYACPGWPERAAELAYRDAFLSHRKNGIYGEMMVAAMIAAAFVETDVRRIVEIGLSEIPQACRLAEAVRRVVAWCDDSQNWQEVADHIDRHYGDLQGCHTITNAAIVVLGLLAGAEDFTSGIATAVMPGYDTDCNGATAGSILGVRAGADDLPGHWVEPLADRLSTIVASVHEARISDLARRTVGVAARLLADGAQGGPAEPLTWGVGE